MQQIKNWYENTALKIIYQKELTRKIVMEVNVVKSEFRIFLKYSVKMCFTITFQLF